MSKEDEVLWEMVDLAPRLTGLPMTVFASPRGPAGHDARIKVNGVHGPRMSLENVADIGVRPRPWLVSGNLPPADQRQVFAWVALNEAALLAYWDFTIDTDEFLARLHRLP